MSERPPTIGHVTAIEGTRVSVQLRRLHRGHIASFQEGVASVSEVGSLVAIDGGVRLFVLRVSGLSVDESRASLGVVDEPRRLLNGYVLGVLRGGRGTRHFVADALTTPALGASVYPLLHSDLSVILRSSGEQTVVLGHDSRAGVPVSIGLNELLGSHMAVLGRTGQGKSCFTAAVLQQLVKLPQPRVVLFDINGEYGAALDSALKEGDLKRTVLGGHSPTRKLPYYALGRHALARLLLPSEKTQRPALNFALENLSRVVWDDSRGGAGLVDGPICLFDDARDIGVVDAGEALETLRDGTAEFAPQWPDMRALGCLIADSQCIRQGRHGLERNTFEYGHVASLVGRIRVHLADPQFTAVFDVEGGTPCTPNLSWSAEGSHLVEEFFGPSGAGGWKLHLVDLSAVASDLLPAVLGSLLELLAFELFQRGPGETYPTLLVLEEAHHYLRQLPTDYDGGQALAYERLSKEGRKFGLSLWLSTQRPSELSPTVLSQCGNWTVFRLLGEADLRAVASAGQWADRRDIEMIPALPRQQALLFGTAFCFPANIRAPIANPLPRSRDPEFAKWSAGGT